jgi:hypothetical protein
VLLILEANSRNPKPLLLCVSLSLTMTGCEMNASGAGPNADVEKDDRQEEVQAAVVLRIKRFETFATVLCEPRA